MIPFSPDHFGVDEAGRGSWAGPLVVTACYFPTQTAVPTGIHIRDSKELKEHQREDTFSFLERSCIFSIASVPVELINAINIQEATRRGMQQCISDLGKKILQMFPDRSIQCLVDGRCIANLPHEPSFVIRGDSTYEAIAAASIIAKVTRDRYMTKLGDAYPHYGFEKHKGYGTSAHHEKILEHGLSPHHRRSFQPMKDLIKSGML